MKDASLIQTIILVVLGFVIVIAVLIFSGILPGFGSKMGRGTTTKVVAWGTLSSEVMRPVIDKINSQNKDTFVVEYVGRSPDNFRAELVDAIALGVGPDLILAPSDIALAEANKLFVTPFETLSRREYLTNFTDMAEVYLSPSGFIGLPILIDPLVMYYNRDLYTTAGIVEVPTNWSAMLGVSQTLTKKDNQNIISQSGLAMGEASNIKNMTAVLGTLILQAGNPIVTRNAEGYNVVLNSRSGESSASQAAFNFFSSFSNSSNQNYSWNEIMDQDQAEFVNGRLANYFGYASELAQIRQKNPNLNFALDVIPQRDAEARKTTHGRVFGVSILKSAKDVNAAFGVAWLLAGAEYSQAFSTLLNTPPARSALLASPDRADPMSEVFYLSAIYSRTWPNVDADQTDEIFKRAVRAYNNSSSNVSGNIIRTANDQLIQLYR